MAPALRPGTYPAETAFDAADANLLLELFWDLFRQGVITLGYGDANPEFPWFKVTKQGQRIVAGENSYFVHDVSGYEARIRREIPSIDDVTLVYLKEALQDFRSGCMLSSTVMLGVAAEHSFHLLLELIERHPSHSKTFASVGRERQLLAKINRFRTVLDSHMDLLPPAAKEDLETNFFAILSVIRTFRNESGHPSGKIIDREQAYVLLELFPFHLRKIYQLMDVFRQAEGGI